MDQRHSDDEELLYKVLKLLWLCFCWMALLLVMVAAVGGVLALYQVNTQIRQHVLGALEKLYPDLDIEIGEVSLNEHRGISIRHLECSIPSKPGQPRRALLAIDELYLECPITIQSLYMKEIEIKKIVLKSPIIRLTREANGNFDEIERLHASGDSVKPVPIEVHNGIILYEDVLAPRPAPVKVNDVFLTIDPPKPESQPQILTDLEKKTVPPGCWSVSGNAKGDLFRQLNFSGFLRPQDLSWELAVSCRQFDWTSDMMNLFRLENPLPANSSHRRDIESFQGRFDVAVSALSDSNSPFGFRFALDGMLSQGSLKLHQINRNVSELNTRFQVTDHNVHIEKLGGTLEAARLLLSYFQEGLQEPTSIKLTTSIRGLYFDADFVDMLAPFLNETTKALLARLEYTGTTDLDASLQLQNGNWNPDSLQLRLSDLTFSFLPFPYRLEHLSGVLQIDRNALLQFTVVGRPTDPLNVKIVGTYADVFRDPVGQVVIHGENVPIDEKLLGALPENHRNVILSLHPKGKIDADVLIKLPPNDLPLEKEFAITLGNVSMQYDKFPYPLRDISGQLLAVNDSWTFQNVHGTNESARIIGNGYLRPVLAPDGIGETMELAIDISAKDVPVDGHLAEAILNADQRMLLEDLQARGKLDLQAQIRYLASQHELNLAFQATPCPEFSVKSTKFPYKIDNLQGEIRYENGTILAHRLTGHHRETKLAAGLFCSFAPEGRWMLRLDPIVIDHIPADRDLLDALPANLKKNLDNLQMSRPFNFKGLVEFSKQGTSAPMQTVWDVGIVLHQNGADIGLPVENLFGEVRLTGYAVDDAFRLAGELAIDSATVYDFHFTDLSGPFFYDGRAQQLIVGQQAGKMLQPPPDFSLLQEFRQSPWFVGTSRNRPIMGQLFGGTFYTEGLVVLGETISYSVHVGLNGANLATIAAETEPSTRKITGTLNLNARLQGAGRKMEAIGGEGKLELRNADVYDAPGMIRLLRELSIREIRRDAGVFSSSDIGFIIQGKQLILNPIYFEGDALSLMGDGKFQLDTRHIDLVMKTRLGNRKTHIPIVSDIISGTGDQIVQLIIQGPITNPTVTRVALPEIQNALRQIQGEEASKPGLFTPPLPLPLSPDRKTLPSTLFPWR